MIETKSYQVESTITIGGGLNSDTCPTDTSLSKARQMSVIGLKTGLKKTEQSTPTMLNSPWPSKKITTKGELIN